MKRVLLVGLSFFISYYMLGQCLEIIGANSDEPEVYCFEAIGNIPSGTVFYITDNEWDSNSNTFNTGEGLRKWTAPNEGIKSGSKITIPRTGSTSCGGTENISGAMNLSASDGDEFYVTTKDPSGGASITAADICSAVRLGSTAGGGGDLPAGSFATSRDNIRRTPAGTWEANSSAPFDFVGDDCESIQLPVELIYFTGEEENKFNKLTWATATEINNAYFSIEYSRDGQGFKEIGQVEGAGNSIETIEYDFLHENPNVGDNYYRLRQVDLDGSFEYSSVVVVNRGGDNNISIRPNQVTGVVNVFLHEGYKKNTKGMIYDLLGAEVMNVNLPANATQYNIDVTDLPSGHYFFRLEGGRNIEVLRFLKRD